LLDHPLVREVVQLLEQEQPDHPPDRQRRSALFLVKCRERALEPRPVDPPRQSVQRLALIEHRRQVGQQELQLRGGFGLGFHRRS
jgi:hypothetical protein